jgi:hypothetical protein
MRERSNRAAGWPSHADHHKLGRLVDFHADAKFVPIDVREAQRVGLAFPYAECVTFCPFGRYQIHQR